MFDFEWFVSAGAGLYVGWSFGKFANQVAKECWSAFASGFKRGYSRARGQ
ncbi:hypothetical protein RCPACIFIC_69 [Rhodobacter phage RcPacific]|nr:hypothetical protein RCGINGERSNAP_69 [Rhodobacter phage RcGingersnap]QXN71839.1 hypothetical protein RCMRWORF_69 [Rhodobacter phage RcMrWorf]UUV44642.1 hypothetical protein RCPACIFIC_69 [Rhodobacter phage RcPacific]